MQQVTGMNAPYKENVSLPGTVRSSNDMHNLQGELSAGTARKNFLFFLLTNKNPYDIF